jgi:hypothetical protein
MSLIAKNNILSNQQNTPNCIFSPITSKRFQEQCTFLEILFIELNKTPGCGVYNVEIEKGKGKGNYILSNFKSNQPRSFLGVDRGVNSQKEQTPGPGTYNTPSDFR